MFNFISLLASLPWWMEVCRLTSSTSVVSTLKHLLIHTFKPLLSSGVILYFSTKFTSLLFTTLVSSTTCSVVETTGVFPCILCLTRAVEFDTAFCGSGEEYFKQDVGLVVSLSLFCKVIRLVIKCDYYV